MTAPKTPAADPAAAPVPTLPSPPSASLADVEWRPDGKPNDKGECRFVPYLNAAGVAALLDQWVGAGGWSDRYESCHLAGKEVLWCHLSVRTPDGEWVTKSDVGVPSNFEAQKGLVSDAFKRAAALKWGAGRNVYQMPTLWAPCRVDNRGNPWPTDKTLPAIRAKLKAQGYSDDVATRVAEPDHDDPAPQAAPSPSMTVAPASQRTTINGGSPLAMMRQSFGALSGEAQAAFRQHCRDAGLPTPSSARTDEEAIAVADALEAFTERAA